MKVLLTGSGGQLGSELVRLLDGSETVALDRSALDVTDERSVVCALAQFEPDLVINCAAFTDVDGAEADVEAAFRTNATAVRFLAQAARAHGAHFTTISTEHVFDGTKSGPYTEQDCVSPVSVYGRSKAAGERCAGAGATVVRTSWLCGETGNNIVKTILNLLDTDQLLYFVDDQVGHPTFAADLAPIILELSLQRRAGIFHVTNQSAVSWFEFAGAVADAAGEDPMRVRPCSTARLGRVRPASRPANGVLDNAALRAAGFEPTRDFREPLAELIDRIL